MTKGLSAGLLACLLLLASQAAAENITELKIESMSQTIDEGEFFEFSFRAGNMVGPACNAFITYWIGSRDRRKVEGQDTIFLKEGNEETISSFLLVPTGVADPETFFLEMQCNDSTALASRPVKVSEYLPAAPKIIGMQILKNEEKEEFEFSYTLKSYSEDPRLTNIKESIGYGQSTVWESTQNVTLAGEETFTRQGPMLPAGSYRLMIEVKRENETSKATRDFEIRAAAQPFEIAVPPLPFGGNISQGLGVAGLAALFVAGGATAITLKYRSRKGKQRESKAKEGLPILARAFPTKAVQALKEELPKNYVCMVESQSQGTLEPVQLDAVLEEAGYSEKERHSALKISEKIPVSQTVTSSVFIDKFEKANCETTVTVTVGNETAKDWCEITLITKVPEFLSENISEIASGQNLQASKEGQILKFMIPRIESGRAATLTYSIAKWITQDKADLVPLAAIINYEEGQSLSVKLKTEKRASREREKKLVAEGERKKARKKKKKKK